ncbi:bifunctional pyr operon transcriptional regulator/uracil phosphoribosyltransferase PyrR [Massilia sp. W12]|uniref:bifunctional pyr operon transcriptional regulator/uracil phosphoribosyltransferase PyrR n=1 Tax=Massilia sp. W12 TaxID=3126507 RepID=UPI0030D00DD2
MNPIPVYEGYAALPDFPTLYRQLLASIQAAALPEPLHIVGIHSGGVWLAQRLAQDMGREAPGALDVSFYRDDYGARGLHANVKPSQIAFTVEGAHILLVDDVLYTGRTTRAAINEIFDYGRPASVRLAALIDRGGRELPIAADFLAARITLPPQQVLVLQRDAQSTLSLSLQTE